MSNIHTYKTVLLKERNMENIPYKSFNQNIIISECGEEFFIYCLQGVIKKDEEFKILYV